MQKLIGWSVCFLLGGSVLVRGADDTADKKTATSPVPAGATPIQLVLALSDGSRVIGTTSINRLKITTKYAKLEFLLSRSRMIEFAGENHTAQVSLQNGDVLNGELAATEIAVKTDSGQVVFPLAKVGNIRIRAGSIGGDYVNSLGVEFVFVPGTKVLFSIWDARVQDYRAYAEANPGVDGRWKNPKFKQGEDHPVVNVSWNDAKAFCKWLTGKERKEGKIGASDEYRLPSDHEWSCAVGIGDQETTGGTPSSKNEQIKGVYPWGKEWPPPKGAGNYGLSLKVDDYEYTSPVGSFKANEYGLYDMGGNVWQWCEDGWGTSRATCVLRGASWDVDDPGDALSSRRSGYSPDDRNVRIGFRCVLECRK